jgi:alpha-N-arabinofuranosidase
VFNEENEEIVIFAVNRSLDKIFEFEIEVQGFTVKGSPKMTELSGHDPKAVNTKSNDSVKPQKKSYTQVTAGNSISAELTPLSWNVIRVGVKS